MAPIQLIHSEQQFAQLRPAMEPYAGCVDPTQWPVLTNPLVMILTTQRTGSTLLCQDIASAWQLPYQPTESFVPPLTGIFNNAIPPESLTQQLANTLQQHNTAPCSVQTHGGLHRLAGIFLQSKRPSPQRLLHRAVDSLPPIPSVH